MNKIKLACISILLLAGCSPGSDFPSPVRVETVTIDAATMNNFAKRIDRIDERPNRNNPPTAALRTVEKDDPRLAVIIRAPERVLKSLGLNGGDRIVMIDRDNVGDLLQEEWKRIGEEKKANAFDTLKYTHFADQIFSRKEKSDSVQLLVYRPGDDASKNPFAIRIEFTD